MKINLFGDTRKVKKYFKNLTTLDRRLIFGFLGVIVVILLFSMAIEIVKDYDNQLTEHECNTLRIDDVRYYLGLQEENSILAFIYAFRYPFMLLVGAVALSWILHGVGFRVIG